MLFTEELVQRPYKQADQRYCEWYPYWAQYPPPRPGNKFCKLKGDEYDGQQANKANTT